MNAIEEAITEVNSWVSKLGVGTVDVEREYRPKRENELILKLKPRNPNAAYLEYGFHADAMHVRAGNHLGFYELDLSIERMNEFFEAVRLGNIEETGLLWRNKFYGSKGFINLKSGTLYFNRSPRLPFTFILFVGPLTARWKTIRYEPW